MSSLSLEDLPKIREKHKNGKIVFCSGGFDVTHAGHVLFFEDCKRHGDTLVVMVGSDLSVRRDKGLERPILNEKIRLKMIDSLKPVDYCFLDKLVPSDKHPLWYIDVAFEKLKPDVYIINEDARDIPYRKDAAKKAGVELVILNRTCPAEYGEISTSKIIKKIKNGDS